MNTRNRIKTVLKAAALAMTVLAVTASSFGAQIAVLSEDFENPDVAPGWHKGQAPAGWVKASTGYKSSENGLIDLGDNQAYAFRYTNSGLTSGVGQIGALELDVTYTITFDVRYDQDMAKLPYDVGLLVFDAEASRTDCTVMGKNATILAEKSGSAPDDGSWTTISFDFTVDPEVAGQVEAVGKDLAVRLKGATSSAIIDNVFVLVPGVDPNLPSVEAGSDWVTWSDAAVTLDDVSVVNNSDPVTPLTYSWSADPADGVIFSATDVESPTITITKATENPSVITLTLAVINEGSSSLPIEDTMTIEVYDDACQAAMGTGAVSFDKSDINADCITDIFDLAEIASKWLVDYTLTGAVAK